MNKKFLPLLMTASLFVLLFISGAIEYPGFGSLRVFFNLFTDNSFLAITAIGMTFVIISGGIDLSVGAVMALSGVVCAILIEKLGLPPLLVFPIVLVGGCAFGAAMGYLIQYYELPPFIVTLAGMFFARGLATVLSEQSIPITDPIYSSINNFGFMLPGRAFVGTFTLVLFGVLAWAVWLAHFTRFGGYIYALGGSRRSAELMGIPCARVTVSIYAISGTLSALAGIVFSFYTSAGYALAAMGTELDTIAAVVIGGTLLSGGYGYVAGTILGVMVMGLMQTWISFNGSLSSWWTKIAIGTLLLIFIVLQQALNSEKIAKIIRSRRK